MESDGKSVIRVGSRMSELALIQTNFVIDSLKKVHPNKEFTIVTMTTLGDRILDVSLPKIGEKSLFTKDLEDALRSDKVDFVVHSLKDLPTTLPEGLVIGAVLEREDPRDALVLREDLQGFTLSTLPEGSVIGKTVSGTDKHGTSSLRRAAQLRGSFPQLRVADVRGNLNTRLRKLDAPADPAQQYAALLLAAAGMQRMGWAHRISKILPCSEVLYAVGQGALAVECRADRAGVRALLAPLSHTETYCRVLAERSFLKTLGGGCSAPVGVSTKLCPFDSQHKLAIKGAVWSPDGAIAVDHSSAHVFTQIRKSQKHKLSPIEEDLQKKFKTDETDCLEAPTPIGVLNRIISERSGNLNCEDTRSTEEILALNKSRIFCGMTENSNMPLDVIIRCENLGKELANALIAKGALDVMKISQDLIRSSTAAIKS